MPISKNEFQTVCKLSYPEHILYGSQDNPLIALDSKVESLE
jgi:hypothetical protein